jgi:hypothetical protein
VFSRDAESAERSAGILAKMAATPIAGYMRGQTNEEIARLRDELAQLKQQQTKPAAP